MWCFSREIAAKSLAFWTSSEIRPLVRGVVLFSPSPLVGGCAFFSLPPCLSARQFLRLLGVEATATEFQAVIQPMFHHITQPTQTQLHHTQTARLVRSRIIPTPFFKHHRPHRITAHLGGPERLFCLFPKKLSGTQPTRGEGEKSTTRPHKGGERKKHTPPHQGTWLRACLKS